MWRTLKDFSAWYRTNGFVIRPPFDQSVILDGEAYCYVLFRHGRFQATLHLGDGRNAEPVVDRLAKRQVESEIAVLTDDAFISLEKWPRKIGSFDSPPPEPRSAAKPRMPRRRWHNVEAFARWYLRSGFPFRIPEGEPTYRTSNSRSIALYRDGQFQAELYLAKPNSASPEHCHPGIDSVIVPWGGEFSSTRNGRLRDGSRFWDAPSALGTSLAFGTLSERLNDSQTHALYAYRKGAAFLSIESWRSDLRPTSVTVNWAGEPVDEGHQGIIQTVRRSSRAQLSFAAVPDRV
jgi:hypothetical protein